jgi:hypothetical protein
MTKKPAPKFRYSAIATIPPVHLSNRGTRWSIRIEAYKGGRFIGYFDVGKAGVNFTKAHARPAEGASKPRPTKSLSWRKLAKLMNPSFD